MARPLRRIALPTLAAFVAGAGSAGAAALDDISSDDRPTTPQPGVAASSHDHRDFTVASYLSDDAARENDLEPAGPSLGDFVAGSFEFDGRGNRDGRAHVLQHVTWIDPEFDPGQPPPEPPPEQGPVWGTVVQVSYVFEDGSQITTEGFQDQRGIDGGARRQFAITGGTGRFEGAEGTLTVTWTEFGETFERTRDTFDFD